MRAFERNRRSRKQLKRKRLTVSLAVALFLHLFLLAFFIGTRAPVLDGGKDENLFLYITEFVPPEKEIDTPVEDPKAFSRKSYNAEKNRVKYGRSLSSPSVFVPPARKGGGETGEELLPGRYFAQNLVGRADWESLREDFRKNSDQTGDRAHYKGDENADETDISVQELKVSKEFKRYSYLLKVIKEVENAWAVPNMRRVDRYTRYIEGDARIVIAKDGMLELVRVVNSSGFPMADKEFVRAVRAAAPYSPFPQNWDDDRIDIVIPFVYR